MIEMNDCQYIRKNYYKNEENVKLIEVDHEKCFGYNVLKVQLDWLPEDSLIIQLIRLEQEEYKTFFLKRKKINIILDESSSFKTYQDYSKEVLNELEQIKETKEIKETKIGKSMILLHNAKEQKAKAYREQRNKWENL